MKKILLFLFLINLAHTSFSQSLSLSGTVKNPTGQSVELNVPFDDGYRQINSVYTNPDKKNAFRFELRGDQPTFVRVRCAKQERYLLLAPGKPLYLHLTDSAKSFVFAGTPKVSNDFLSASPLNKPSFVINNLSHYKKWPVDSLTNLMLPLLNDELNRSLAQIMRLNIPGAIQDAISTELKYYYANQLMQFTRSIMTKISRQAAWKKVDDIVVAANPMPTVNQLSISPAANTYLHNYALHQFKEIGILIKESPAGAKSLIAEKTGMPYDTVMHLANQFGEDYLLALVAHKSLPALKYEKLLANMTLQYTDAKQLKFAEQLQNDLRESFPNSPYLNNSTEKILALEKTMVQNERNKNIVFVPANTKLTSLKQLVAPYKGKVVYIDIWGTWCGPCVQEMVEHSAQVKQKFAGQNVVFLYLEMDYDNNEAKWQEFVNTHALTGYHYRASQQQMEKFFADLLNTTNVPRIFPTYIIFDANGNLVDKNAKRPSDGNALYAQLGAALKK